MPGLISPSSAASFETVAGMKRSRTEDAPAPGAVPIPKKRRVTHSLRHTQPVQHVVEPIGGGFGADGDKQFFDHQLQRAIAIQLKTAGFDGAKADVLEYMRGMVEDYMTGFLDSVRTSMCSSRRTETVPHDWIYALKAVGITGSLSLETHLDTGEIPPAVLQPHFAPPEPKEAPQPDLEGLLGPELSGKAEKESRKYIPAHFPAFPSKHTYMATPVFPQRESDPRKVREKAAQDGIAAENSLRKLMAAQKAGLQNRKGGKRKQSERMKKTNAMWREAMEASMKQDEEREALEKEQRKKQLEQEHADEDGEYEAIEDLKPISQSQTQFERKINLDEPVQVNYERKFWRKNARGV